MGYYWYCQWATLGRCNGLLLVVIALVLTVALGVWASLASYNGLLLGLTVVVFTVGTRLL